MLQELEAIGSRVRAPCPSSLRVMKRIVNMVLQSVGVRVCHMKVLVCPPYVPSALAQDQGKLFLTAHPQDWRLRGETVGVRGGDF